MMVRLWILIVVLFAGALTQPAEAQTAGAVHVPVAPILELPIKWFGHHVVVNAKLAGHDQPLQMVFDTGASSTVLDTNTAESLGVKADQQANAMGTGGTSTYKFSLNQTLRFSKDVEAKGMLVVLVDLKTLSEGAGTKYDGITGFDFLNLYLMEIDHSNDRMKFYPRDTKLELADYKEIPLRFKNGIPIPVVECTIELESGDKLTGDVLVDTGAALSLRLNSPFQIDNDVMSKSKSHYTNEGIGLTKKSSHHVVKADSLVLAGFKFDELQVQVATSKAGVSGLPDLMGILGNEVLKKFDIVFDYQAKTMYLKHSEKFDTPFQFNTSGVSLSLRDKKIYVRSVVAGSPAAKAGIQMDWQLVSIDGVEVSDFYQAADQLRGEQKTLALRFRSEDGKEQAVDLPLARLLDRDN